MKELSETGISVKQDEKHTKRKCENYGVTVVTNDDDGENPHDRER